MNMDIPQRKEIRLKSVKYNEAGAYFLTVCTYNRKKLLWNNVGTGNARPYNINRNSANEGLCYQKIRIQGMATTVSRPYC